MPAWYYYTIYKCPDCGATYEQYDHTAPWCDSGLTSPPVIEQRCDECSKEVQKQDLTEEACEMLESAATYLAGGLSRLGSKSARGDSRELSEVGRERGAAVVSGSSSTTAAAFATS